MIEFIEQHLAVFIDPSERVFFVHLLLALVAASAVCSYQESKFDLKEQLGSLLTGSIGLTVRRSSIIYY